jgi:arylsulfatase A-like enzyme
MGKQNIYDHSVRVPMIFSGPGIPKDRRTDEMAYLLDIYPTLCELTGVQAPPSLEGRSLTSIMHGGPGREALFLAYLKLQRGVRTDRWKLIEYTIDGAPTMTQLFDIAGDPWEITNLASAPEHADVLADLRAQLARFQVEWDDPMVVHGG